MKIDAAKRLIAATHVPLHKYVPDKEAHAKLPLPPGKWTQVERNYMRSNIYEVSAKGDKLAKVVAFYEKLGYKVKEWLDVGQTHESWGATVAKMKAPSPDLRLKLLYDHHNKLTIIEFKMIASKAK
jgi:hypothetical protein